MTTPASPDDAVERLLALVFVVLFVMGAVGSTVSVGVGTARAAGNTSSVGGTPTLSASAPNARFEPGATGTIQINLTNDAMITPDTETHPPEAIERAGKARGVRVAISDTGDAPITVATGTRSVETIAAGETAGPYGFDVAVQKDATPGIYEVTVTTKYRHAKRVEYNETDTGDVQYNETVVSTTETDTITVVIQRKPRFELEYVSHDVPVGGQGTVTVSVTNTGDEDVTESTVSLTSTDSDFYFGAQSPSSEATVGEWDAGETKRLEFRAGTVEEAVRRSYPIDLTVQFTDSTNSRDVQTRQIGITPEHRTEFEIESVDHDVPLNGEGTLSITVDHDASSSIEDVSVTASTTASELYVGSEASRTATTVVKDWNRFADETLKFRVGTTENAVERSYPIELTFEYTDADDNDNSRTTTVSFTPQDRDRFTIRSVEHTVALDGQGTVTINATNSGPNDVSDVAVRASVTDSEVYLGSETSRSAVTMIEEWDSGANQQLTFRVGTTENAVERAYPVELSFDYTDAEDNDNAQTEFVEFRPRKRPQFVVESIDHNVPVGGTGRVAVTLRNEGPVNATNATVTISSDVDVLYFGSGGELEPVTGNGIVVDESEIAIDPPQRGTPATEAYVGNWPVGDNRTVQFRAGFHESAINRSYVARVSTDYENEAGDDMPVRSTTIGITPFAETQFDFEQVESNLHVGEDGDLIARVTNVADRPIESVVVTAENDYQGVSIYNPRYAIGTLDPGESETVRYRVGVSEETEYGPRLFKLSARYRDPEGNVRQTDSQDVAVPIGPRRDAFTIETANATFAPGESDELVLQITNRRNETLSNVQAKLFTDDPLDSEDDSAFVPELDPGESATIRMGLSVGDGATAKTYAASVDLRFDDARGDSELSNTYRVPVTVEESSGVASVPAILGAVMAVAISGAVGWRRDALSRGREWYEEHADDWH